MIIGVEKNIGKNSALLGQIHRTMENIWLLKNAISS